MAEIKVERIHGPARREILKGLRAFNTRALGKFEFKPLSVTLRHRGAIVGGLYGETYLNWMYISLFWLADEFRGKGFGSKIMQRPKRKPEGAVSRIPMSTPSASRRRDSTRSSATASSAS